MQAKEYFDDIAECWDNEFEFHIVARNTAALVSGAASGACDILDVGCGTGEMFTSLLDAGASEITGVDLSEKMIQYAEGKIGFDPRISLHCCDILDFEEPGYDAAVMFDAYQYMPDKSALIGKIHSLLRPKGALRLHSVLDAKGSTHTMCLPRQGLQLHCDPRQIKKRLGTLVRC